MITQVRLKNFKCYEDQPFELGNLTLFAGNNGMGKSSVIQSLLLLKQSYVSTKLTVQKKVDLFNHSFVDLESAEKLCYTKAFPRTVGIEIDTESTGDHAWQIDAAPSKESVLDVIYSGNN